MPTCSSTSAGRPTSIKLLVETYYNNRKKQLSDYDIIDSKVYVSKFQGLSLEEYSIVKKYICDSNHSTISCDCKALINIAQTVLSNGICCLSSLFKNNFPNVTYQSFNARRRVLQMPIVVFPVCNQLYIMEKVKGLSYVHLSDFLTSKLTATEAKQGMSKEDLKKLLLITSSEKERECIKYAVYKSSGYTPTRARREYGLDKMALRASKVEASVTEALEIIKAYDDIMDIQNRTLVDCYGQECDTSSVSSTDSNEESSEENVHDDKDDTAAAPTDGTLLNVLIQSEYNWFTFMEQLHDLNYNVSDTVMRDFFLALPNMNLEQRAIELVVQSHRAYIGSQVDFKEDDRTARCINGEVVTDSDSDECDDKSSKLIKEKKIKLRRKIRRLKAKAIAECRFLSRTISKKASTLIKEFPNIGEIVEDFVRDHNVGADSWRRTGVLTFDGNVHIKDKVTYSKIQKHLESKTCKQYSTPTVQGTAVLTTRTDYVNRHHSVLQTTSYNFTRTKNTGEVCVGVVKAVPIHTKNPAQHYSDLQMLSELPELKPVFYNPTSDQVKPIDCIRVDGAGDEGPSHESVQYWWTDWHLNNSKVVTLVTTRCSGSSYMNRVELQNGCLSLGHANTFIPSTLAGSNLDSESGNVNEEKLKENLNLAITAYISRVSGCPCGDSDIKLYRGSDSTALQSVTSYLDTLLKGSKKQKELLQNQQPELYNRFQKVWDVRNRHMVQNLPTSYLFFLKCCFEKECPHPVCQSGQSTVLAWYPGGPTVNYLPFPFPDPQRPHGGICSTCKDFCCGHYITKLVDTTKLDQVKSIIMPPSVVLKESFSKQGITTVCPDLVKKVLLSEDDTKIWLEHLATVAENRRRGAAKAALTRKNKSHKDDDEAYCGTCKSKYSTSNTDFWICCDLCNLWYCSSCEKLASEPDIETYLCRKCSQ